MCHFIPFSKAETDFCASAALLWALLLYPKALFKGTLFLLANERLNYKFLQNERVSFMNSAKRKKFNLKKQLGLIYTSGFFSGLRITDAVWVALLVARGYSLWEIGFAESVFHVVSLICEVPSGMFADMLGRKKTLVLGGFLITVYNILMAFAPNFLCVCLAMGLNALAYTMFSGTDSAMTYDSMKEANKTDDYIKVNAKCTQINLIASALGSLSSTLVNILKYTGFYLLSGAFEFTSMISHALMTEPVVTDAQAERENRNFLETLKKVPMLFVNLCRDSYSILKACPFAVKLIVSTAIVSIPTYLTKMFLQERLIELGWSSRFLFVPMLLSSAAAILGTLLAAKAKIKSLRKLYLICAILVGGGTVLVGTANAWFSIFGMMLVQSILEIWFLVESQKLNDAIPSDQRATIISVDGMCYSILMIPTSPLVGKIGDLFGNAGAGLTVLGILVMLSSLCVLFKKKK